jgi:hypothetical protein
MGDAECGGTQNLDDDYELDAVESDEPAGWARLLSTNPEYESKTVDESMNEVVIGRTSDCFISIALPVVSGRHCKLVREDQDVVFLYDIRYVPCCCSGCCLGQPNFWPSQY